MTVHLKRNGFSYQVAECEEVPEGERKNPLCSFHRIDIQFEGSLEDPVIREGQPEPTKLHYYLADQDGLNYYSPGVFSDLIYTEVYPGIDLHFSAGGSHGFEYSFHVRAGADPALIQLSYSGQNAITLEGRELVLDVFNGQIRERIPKTYYLNSGTELECAYALDQNRVGFQLPDSTTDETLVIDPAPQLVYATYFGGELMDIIIDADIDNEGNIYQTGRTHSTTNIASTGAYQQVLSGATDGIILKWNGEGSLEWATYWGGTEYEELDRIQVSGNRVVVLGLSATEQGLVSPDAYITTGGGLVPVLVEFNATGQLNWSTYAGSDGEFLFGLEILDNGVIAVLGNSFYANLFFNDNAYQQFNAGGNDMILTYWDEAGQPLYSTFFGGVGSEQFQQIQSDTEGGIYLLGRATSEGLPTSGVSIQPELEGGIDLFLMKIQYPFEIEYATYFGSNLDELAPKLQVISPNHIAFSGRSENTASLITPGAHLDSPGYDYFLASLVLPVELIFCTNVAGNVNSLASDGSSIFLGGETYSEQDISTIGAFQTNFLTPPEGEFGGDGFIQSYNLNGQLNWGTYFGDILYDLVNKVDVFNGRLYVSGVSAYSLNYQPGGENLLSTPDAWQPEPLGVADCFLAIFDAITGVPEDSPKLETNISIYPVPAENDLFIDLPKELAGMFKMKIIDMQGKMIMEEMRFSSGMPHHISLEGLVRGAYVLQVILDKEIVSKSFVKW